MKKKQFGMMMYAPEEGGASATDLLDAPTLTVEPTGDAPAEEVVEKEAAPVAPTIDYGALAVAVGETLKSSGFAPAKAEAPKMTKEEAAKALNVWEPSPEFMAKFGNLETQGAAFAELRDGMLKYFDTVSQLRMREMEERFNGELGPVRQFVTEQEATGRESRFDVSYKQLALPEMRPLKGVVVQDLATRGALKGKSEPEIFKLIATGMEAFIKSANPAFKLTPAGSSPAVQQQNNSALKPSRSGSGGGGGGNKSADTSGKPKAVAFL